MEETLDLGFGGLGGRKSLSVPEASFEYPGACCCSHTPPLFFLYSHQFKGSVLGFTVVSHSMNLLISFTGYTETEELRSLEKMAWTQGRQQCVVTGRGLEL